MQRWNILASDQLSTRVFLSNWRKKGSFHGDPIVALPTAKHSNGEIVMRKDTPPHCSAEDDFDGNPDFEAMLAEEGILVDAGDEYDGEDSDEELEEIEFDELERRLQSSQNETQNEDGDSDNDAMERHPTPVDLATLTFTKHKIPVFSCDFHPEYDVAVTGGQDDTAYLWETHSGKILQEVHDHTDTVTATKFSHDGNYLFTADMAGNIFVFKLRSSTQSPSTEAMGPSSSSNNEVSSKANISMDKIWEYAMGDLSWAFWHDRANVLFAGSADTGEIYMWRLPSGECKVFAGPGTCCTSSQLTEDGKRLFASYHDGSLRLWDLRNGSAVLTIDDQHIGDSGPTVACDKNGSLYASGDTMGKILFSTPNGPVQTVQTTGFVEALAFSPSTELKMLASASLDGETTIWDYAHYIKRVNCIQPEGQHAAVCSMKWLSNYTLAVGTVDGNILIFDGRSGCLKQQLTGHRAYVYEFCYNQRNNMLLSVSEDGTAKIFTISQLDD